MKFTCYHCTKVFERTRRLSHNTLHLNQKSFCSRKCCSDSRRVRITLNCNNCGKQIEKLKCHSGNNNYCSQSCSATYNNTHKTKGIRISKLEKYLQLKLEELYPNLEFLFNDKLTINSELDIYIPSLKLAFELNGIFHYEPVFSEEKLTQIKNNDERKFQACIEHSISLCIIDTSKQVNFKESTSQIYLNLIQSIIDRNL